MHLESKLSINITWATAIWHTLPRSYYFGGVLFNGLYLND